MYRDSINDSESFWAAQASHFLDFIEPWTAVKQGDFHNANLQWFVGARLNVCYNCVDRHLGERGSQPALIWEGNDPQKDETRILTYQQLYEEIVRFSQALKQLGVKKGSRVCIYLPMIPEAVIAMLACARIGAIHSVVFSGFSAQSLQTRIQDAGCSLVITADEGFRANKTIALKKNCDEALLGCPEVKRVIVVKRSGNAIPWNNHRDLWYEALIQKAEGNCNPEPMDASQPLFILYTSGSTGKPKGIIHNSAGYLLYAAMTHHYVFDYKPGEVFWCTADIGWITGHSYLIYGPLANGATCLMYEGVPNYPNPSRCWELIDKHQVTTFYTSPTLIRSLRKEGDSWLNTSSRKSLKVLGSVGEPINPEVWHWYFKSIGQSRCTIVDTWWQTETGGILISPITHLQDLKAGSAADPFFGIVPDIVDSEGKSIENQTSGKLVIKKPWPGLMQGIYGDHIRFQNYFTEIPGAYLSGDEAYRDEQGLFWINGRYDDVIKVSGHRLGSAELENALLQHPGVAEAAVVGTPDDLTGEAIIALVNLKSGVDASEILKEELKKIIIQAIGPIAKLKQIEWVEQLPKTRSGKIMRRVLRKLVRFEFEDLGDLSTLVDPAVIGQLVRTIKLSTGKS